MKTALFALLICGSASAADLGGILSPLTPQPAPPPTLRVGNQLVTAPVQGNASIEEKDVLSALEKELLAQLNLEGDLRLSFARPWSALHLGKDSQWNLRVSQMPAGNLSSSFLLRFQIESGNRSLGEWQTLVRAQLWRPVWVASRRLDRGQAMDSSFCTQQTLDTLREKQSLVPAETNLALYEMAQTLSQDRPLAWRDLIARPLVRKGQIVEVAVTDGTMNITMKGMAMSSGGVGEAVIVRNLDSRKDFPARVLRPNTVQVAF